MKRSFALVALALWVAGCTKSHPGNGLTPPAPPVSVKTKTIQPRQLVGETSFPGSVRSRRQAVLATKLPGRILYLQAEEGDILSAGSVAVQIDTSDLQARTLQAEAGRVSALAARGQSEAGLQQSEQAVAQSQAQLKTLINQRQEASARLQLAQKEELRYRGLAQEGAIPRQRADQALTELQVAQSRAQQLQAQIASAQVGIRQSQAGVTQARSALERSQAGISEAEAGIQLAASDLSYGTIRAPFRGVVVEKSAWQGELNTPGRPLLKLQDLDQLEVSLNLPESRLEHVQHGQILQAEVPSLKRKLQLKVRQIVAATDPSTRSFSVRLSLLDNPPRLLPGTFVKVSLPDPSRALLILPEAAIAERGQLEGAFVVSQGQVEFRLLQLGGRLNDGREILSGLQAGEEVILGPSESLQDGQKVQIQ
ncbi:efflux RND transporter periplasmic adaptor subunit [bacterium]|nr:efflux RND transporter periplasmic adaptor subunit [bacterium]